MEVSWWTNISSISIYKICEIIYDIMQDIKLHNDFIQRDYFIVLSLSHCCHYNENLEISQKFMKRSALCGNFLCHSYVVNDPQI